MIYVGYILADYAQALWMSTSKATVEKAIAHYHELGGKCSTWITKYNVGKGLIELDCD